MRHVSYTGLERKICDEIRQWSQYALETPNEECGNLPVCAYANKAWGQDTVGISFKYDPGYQSLYSLISTFEDKYEVIILVDLAYEEDPEKFHKRYISVEVRDTDDFRVSMFRKVDLIFMTLFELLTIYLPLI